MKRLRLTAIFLIHSAILCAGNQPDRIEWFRDAGFGLFIHWSLDSQIGSVISHSVVGASEDYVNRFFDLLPTTFNPKKFNADDWAVLAKLAGFKYVVFTAKHHSGFCMYNTTTTKFGISHTPYGKDVTAEIVRAFRSQGIAPGFYFSPDDFYYMHRHNMVMNRGKLMLSDKGYMDYNRSQMRELLTQYGNIDVLFFDGPADGLRELGWELQPNLVVTRGAMQTPEQYVPSVPLEGPWEACLTMGTEWSYKPTNEEYKTGTELIEILVETRAKGGNLLLNVGPKPDGELPIEQEALLREIALWNLVNGESIYGVRPWVVTNEKNVWFTKKKNEDTVYAFLTKEEPWRLGSWKTFTLKSVRAGKQTVVSVLGQSGEVLEYSNEIPRTKWNQETDGLHITVNRAQRLYTDRKWPNPVVLRITNAQVAMVPPRVTTVAAGWDAARKVAVLEGELNDLGKADAVEVGFQYRASRDGVDAFETRGDWQDLNYTSRSSTGAFRAELSGVQETQSYEFRAVVKHPLITIYGEHKVFQVGR